MEKTSLGDVKEKHAAQVVELQRNHAGVIERVQKEGNVMLGKLRSDFSAQLGQVKKENNELLRERESERTVYENTVRQLKVSSPDLTYRKLRLDKFHTGRREFSDLEELVDTRLPCLRPKEKGQFCLQRKR